MTPQIEFMDVFADVVNRECNTDTPLSLNELSASNSLYAELGVGFTDAMYYSKRTVKTAPVLLLCRNINQRRCIEQLSDICNYFQRLKTYPQGQSFSWLDATIAKEPSKIGRDEDGTYHYSCILNCKICY